MFGAAIAVAKLETYRLIRTVYPDEEFDMLRRKPPPLGLAINLTDAWNFSQQFVQTRSPGS